MRGKYLFGPIWSRRLGKSLGINLTPYKTCNLNCVYCECGLTSVLTMERKEYVPHEEVIENLARYRESTRFRENPPSYLTFAGFGEPTLNSSLGKIIHFIKQHFPENRLALITNGTLLGHFPEIEEEIQEVDLIIPSLDAGREDTFERINRPHPMVDFGKYVEGLLNLRKYFQRDIWLEVFIVEGLNDAPREVEALRRIIERMLPNEVHINSLDRRPAEDWVRAPSPEKLQRIAHALRGKVITSPPTVLSVPRS